ncbi:lipopolysaccharide-induced tumor necrosis factor-alpha factor homolog-like [Hippocampus zosterae]|uniref:lipopolysaccharide-induced tumor necrosis factor-alpha factor homolog-like n=1 Tax=Hippocampus zosterae TaxID=109293 RepID=UPI00223D10B7|nr:lipopolysaccharide-induced tumor necrosis factor-alpha factor homolog-like [Hippocampus zosterae]
MASDVKHPPPYTIPVDQPEGDNVKIYHLHTPFNPVGTETVTPAVPVYTSGGGGLSSGFDGDGHKKLTSYDTSLGFNSGMTTCPSCQQQVMTNVSYKPGKYAWLMTLLFFCLGLVLCCCLLPLFFKRFKDAHHTCPRCNRLLHVEKRKCCD